MQSVTLSFQSPVVSCSDALCQLQFYQYLFPLDHVEEPARRLHNQFGSYFLTYGDTERATLGSWQMKCADWTRICALITATHSAELPRARPEPQTTKDIPSPQMRRPPPLMSPACHPSSAERRAHSQSSRP